MFGFGVPAESSMGSSSIPYVASVGQAIRPAAPNRFSPSHWRFPRPMRTALPPHWNRLWLISQHLKQHMDGSITMHQADYPEEKLKIIHIPKTMKNTDYATPGMIAEMRAQNGALGWISKQTRPDLSVQVSLSQQSMP